MTLEQIFQNLHTEEVRVYLQYGYYSKYEMQLSKDAEDTELKVKGTGTDLSELARDLYAKWQRIAGPIKELAPPLLEAPRSENEPGFSGY